MAAFRRDCSFTELKDVLFSSWQWLACKGWMNEKLFYFCYLLWCAAHTTRPKVCGHLTILKPRTLMCCSNSLHTSGFRLSARCWRASVRSGSMFQFVPKVSGGVEVRALCRSIGSGFVHRGDYYVGTRKDWTHTAEVGSILLSNISVSWSIKI